MNKLISISISMTRRIWSLAFFALSIVPIVFLAYFLGFKYLQGITGGDSLYHLSNIIWFDKFFPHIPLWYPLQNGGVVPVWGYPSLPYFVVILIHRISSLSLLTSFQLFGFVSVPLTAIGLYLFVWSRLKSQIMGFVGAIFYLLMPLSWAWLFDWGFYTECVSYVFIFPTLIFYDIFLVAFLEKRINIFSRLSLLLAILFGAILFLFHPTTFFVTIAIIFSLSLFQGWRIKKYHPMDILINIGRVILPFSIFVLFTVSILSFISFDFYSYSANSSLQGSVSESAKKDFLQNYATPVDSLLGLNTIAQTDFKFGHRNLVIPMAVWIPAIGGAILALFLSKKMFALAFLAVISVAFFEWPILAWYANKVPLVPLVIHHRAMLIFMRSVIPIVASFGIYSLIKLIFGLPFFWIRKGKLFLVKNAYLLFTAGILTPVVASVFIVYFANKPSTLWLPTQVRYGPVSFDTRDPFNMDGNVKPVTDDFVKYITNLENWPRPNTKLNLAQAANNPFSDFIKVHKDENLRIDISPFLGGVVQSLGIESQSISQINLYAVTMTQLKQYWGIEQQILFSKSTGDTVNVNNIVKWFGTKYLFLNDPLDYIPKYAEDTQNWLKVDEAGIWKFLKPVELYSWTTKKPTILVIGSKEKQVFEPVFKTAINGGFDYDDGWLVQGSTYVDDYSLVELEKFDSLILYGYSFRNRSHGEKLINDYLNGGGNVFINSGWQYTDADWQNDATPAYLPSDKIVWSTNYSASSQYIIDDTNVAGGVDASTFSPLSWDNRPWGVSVPGGRLRSWAKPVLSIDGKPLIVAGTVGKGKVIWTGMNLLAHINTYSYNPEEVKLWGNLLKWLGNGQISDETTLTPNVELIRRNPDKIEFRFGEASTQTSTLYWRESQFYAWRARLTSQAGKTIDIPIYRAGPGFMLMRLPALSQNSRLTLTFETGLRTKLGMLVTILAGIILLIYVFFGSHLRPLFDKLFSKIKVNRVGVFSKVRGVLDKSDEDNNY